MATAILPIRVDFTTHEPIMVTQDTRKKEGSNIKDA